MANQCGLWCWAHTKLCLICPGQYCISWISTFFGAKKKFFILSLRTLSFVHKNGSIWLKYCKKIYIDIADQIRQTWDELIIIDHWPFQACQCQHSSPLVWVYCKKRFWLKYTQFLHQEMACIIDDLDQISCKKCFDWKILSFYIKRWHISMLTLIRDLAARSTSQNNLFYCRSYNLNQSAGRLELSLYLNLNSGKLFKLTLL